MGFDCEFQMEYDDATGKNSNKPGRVSVTNYFGETFYDVFVYFPEKRGFQYWRNSRSKNFGCYKEDVKPDHGARPIAEVAQNLHDIFDGAIMVGHATENDIKIFDSWVFDGVAYRDTQTAGVYRGYANPRSIHGPKLSTLALSVLGYQIQGGEHSSVEDAQATMELYRLHEDSIENEQWHLMNFKMGTDEEILAKRMAHYEECMAEEKLWHDSQATEQIDGSTASHLPQATLMTVSTATIWYTEVAILINEVDAADFILSVSSSAASTTHQLNALSPPISTSHIVDASDEHTGGSTTHSTLPITTPSPPPSSAGTSDQAVHPASSPPPIQLTTKPTKSTGSSEATKMTAKEKAAIKIAYPRPRLTCADRPANYVPAADSVSIVAPVSSSEKAKASAARKIASPHST
jgi:RNA exonuclease 4